MIYLDTSLLVKLYLPEPDSRAVAEAVGKDAQVVVSDLARPEFASAVARLAREGALSASRGRGLLQRMDEDWPRFTRVQVTDEVIAAGRAALDHHALRTLDALQLGSALVVARAAPSPLPFGTANRRLGAAAEAEGLPPLLAP